MSTPAHDMAQPTGGDMAKMSDGGNGLLALCATCTQNSECISGSCLPYMNGTIKRCSHSCSAATAATDCPGVAMCTNMNTCKCM